MPLELKIERDIKGRGGGISDGGFLEGNGAMQPDYEVRELFSG